MSIFVVSRLDVGFFGAISGENIALFSTNVENASSANSPLKSNQISCNDKFSVVHTSDNSDCQKPLDNVKNTILCGSISNCGKYLVASDAEKKVYLWKKTENVWMGTCSRTLARKAYKILFTNSGTNVLLVDRGGDVFSFPVKDNSDLGELILGHICIILDIAITKTDSHVITCDRDWKIRVSMYPNCYNILTYCFGHDEFVSSMQLFDNSCEMLMSGSGDGTIRIWNYKEGKEIFSCDAVKSQFKGDNGNTCLDSTLLDISSACSTWKRKPAIRMLRYCSTYNIVAALFYPQPAVGIYKLSESENMLLPLQLLNCRTLPCDAYFDHKGNLWIFRAGESSDIIVFECTIGNDIHFVEMLDKTVLEACIASELNGTWPHTIMQTFDLDMKYLYKVTAEDWDERKSGSCVKKSKIEIT